MADLVPVPASVKIVSGGLRGGPDVSGEALTAGQACYKKVADGLWYKAQNDSVDPVTSTDEAGGKGLGIAMNSAPGAGQPVSLIHNGEGSAFTPGVPVVVGEIYCLSASSGGICPKADVTSGKYLTIIGYGSYGDDTTTTRINTAGVMIATGVKVA